MISWINRSGLTWQYVPMNDSQKREIKMLFKNRLKLFYLLLPSLAIACFEAFGMVYQRIKRSLTHEYGDIDDFALYYLLVCSILYAILCYVAYRVSIRPIRKDCKEAVLILYKVQVSGKQYFEHVGKCFLELAALPPHNKYQVTTDQYERTEIGDWIDIAVAPHTIYFFDPIGKYYLL